MSNVTDEFASWAVSFSGYCEGDLSADVWICGLEPSSGNVDRLGVDASGRERLVEKVGDPIREPSAMNVARHETFPYGRKMLRLACAIRGQDWRGADAERCPLGPKDLLKLNLFPFAAPDMKSWSQECLETSGLADKAEYQAWCRTHRFPLFSDLVAERPPKVIVGTGVSYAGSYVSAFAGPRASGEQQLSVRAHAAQPVVHGTTVARCRRFDIVHPTGAPTRMYVVPFLSFRRGCLNSDGLIEAVGNHIRTDLAG